MKIHKSTQAFTLIELLVVISIIAILAGIALPVFSQVQEKGAQTKDLSNAKQIGLGLKLFAGDNDGNYPTISVIDGTTALTTGSTSNDVFANLIPNYVPVEKVFYLAKSPWSTRAGYEDTTTKANILVTKTNNYAFMFGLNDTSNPSFPLLADAPKTAGVGGATYSTVESEPGGVWKGKKAIVIRNDQSGAVETCVVDLTAKTSVVKGLVGAAGGTKDDIFKQAATWLQTGQQLLQPK